MVRLRLVRLEQEALRRDGDYVNSPESEHPMFKASVPVEADVTVEVTIRHQTSGSGARVTQPWLLLHTPVLKTTSSKIA